MARKRRLSSARELETTVAAPTPLTPSPGADDDNKPAAVGVAVSLDDHAHRQWSSVMLSNLHYAAAAAKQRKLALHFSSIMCQMRQYMFLKFPMRLNFHMKISQNEILDVMLCIPSITLSITPSLSVLISSSQRFKQVSQLVTDSEQDRTLLFAILLKYNTMSLYTGCFKMFHYGLVASSC